MEEQMVKILLINGGATKSSRTRGLTKAFADSLTIRQVDTSLFDVGVDILPIFTDSEKDREAAAVQKLIQLADQADGFVICTPEYHNGVSGALKNALDFLGSRQFKGKPVIIGAACGGGKGGINALNNLRQILRGVYALTLPDQIVVDPEHYDEHLRLVHPDMLQRVEFMTEELIRITGLLMGKGQVLLSKGK
jgi:azobenzene reductase